ncbi:MAG: DUF167 domain-containing protein [Desulfobacterales bacterium]
MPFYSACPHGLIVNIHLQPGASRDLISGLHGEALKVRVTAPPIEGRANQALIRLLAKELRLPPSAVSIVAGASSRTKRIHLHCPPGRLEALVAALGKLAQS